MRINWLHTRVSVFEICILLARCRGCFVVARLLESSWTCRRSLALRSTGSWPRRTLPCTEVCARWPLSAGRRWSDGFWITPLSRTSLTLCRRLYTFCCRHFVLEGAVVPALAFAVLEEECVHALFSRVLEQVYEFWRGGSFEKRVPCYLFGSWVCDYCCLKSSSFDNRCAFFCFNWWGPCECCVRPL